jgi:hypothetical protein
MEVFFVLLSEKAGSTPIEFIATSAYFLQGKAIVAALSKFNDFILTFLFVFRL